MDCFVSISPLDLQLKWLLKISEKEGIGFKNKTVKMCKNWGPPSLQLFNMYLYTIIIFRLVV